MDTASFTTTSSKSSKEKAEKAERREQLAAQLKAKQLQQAAEKNSRATSRVTSAKKDSTTWEEGGAMYSLDGFL